MLRMYKFTLSSFADYSFWNAVMASDCAVDRPCMLTYSADVFGDLDVEHVAKGKLDAMGRDLNARPVRRMDTIVWDMQILVRVGGIRNPKR